MKEYLNIGMNYIKGFNQAEMIGMIVVFATLLYVLYNKNKYRELFANAVILAETTFNHKDNQAKLDFAVKFVNDKMINLPTPAKLVLKHLVTKKHLVDIIEKTVQKFSDVFGTGKKVDVIGNEE